MTSLEMPPWQCVSYRERITWAIYKTPSVTLAALNALCAACGWFDLRISRCYSQNLPESIRMLDVCHGDLNDVFRLIFELINIIQQRLLRQFVWRIRS